MRIVAASNYCEAVDREPPALKTLATEAVGSSVRRVGRFVQLALVGAGRCVAGVTLPPATATYVTSGRGDLGTTLEAMAQMYDHHHAPAPFTFIETVGNAACFQVASVFGLSGRSQFVTSRYAPLEAALRLAALDLGEGGVTTALCGSVDICTSPLAAHRERVGVRASQPVGEGSHWFLLEAGGGSRAALGVIRCVRSFTDDGGLCRYLEEQRIDPERAAIAAGQHLGPERLERFRAASGIARVFDYRSALPWYDSQTGHGIERFLRAPTASTLVHVDGDPSGRATLLVLDTGGG